ncbi:MAG: CHAT domain-containing protein [Gammaproteobacteria bacterium]|nr:CHAT domain-containing protein [Gammaproteobacteria bacterium]
MNEQAIFLADNAQELLLQWHWQDGRRFKARNDLDLAVKAYLRAVWHMENFRKDIENCAQGSGYGFAEVIKPLYLELADLLLQRAERLDNTVKACEPLPRGIGAFVQAKKTQSDFLRHCSVPDDKIKMIDATQCDLHNAQAAMERLKRGELRDYFQDGCVTRNVCVTPVETLISNDTAVIYHILLPERAVALVYSVSGLEQIPLKISSVEELQAHVDSLLKIIRNGASSFLYTHSAAWLYQKLIQPLEAKLGGEIKTLVFVPDEHLRVIPMSVLYDRDAEKFLLEKYAIVSTPGMTLTEAVRPRIAPKINLLAGGLSSMLHHPEPKYSELPELPYAEKEISFISELYPTHSLVNENFSWKKMEKAVAKMPYSIVHIASHTFFEADAGASVILTAKGVLTMDNLKKLVQLGQSRERSVELLALSACATAAGEDKAVLGLAGVAVKTGAPAAIGTLWRVSDRGTALLMKRFYEVLSRQSGLSKAKALQQAQLYLLQGNAGDEFKNPYHWAPFLLIGNWLPIVQ